MFILLFTFLNPIEHAYNCKCRNKILNEHCFYRIKLLILYECSVLKNSTNHMAWIILSIEIFIFSLKARFSTDDPSSKGNIAIYDGMIFCTSERTQECCWSLLAKPTKQNQWTFNILSIPMTSADTKLPLALSKRTLVLTMGNTRTKYDICCSYLPCDPVFYKGFKIWPVLTLTDPWPCSKTVQKQKFNYSVFFI